MKLSRYTMVTRNQLWERVMQNPRVRNSRRPITSDERKLIRNLARHRYENWTVERISEVLNISSASIYRVLQAVPSTPLRAVS